MKIKNPGQIPFKLFSVNSRLRIFRILKDETFVKLKFRGMLGEKLNLKSPRTFNEKLQWLKLYDRNPIYTTMVDKCAVKDYVASVIGEEYIIPALGVWKHFDDIDFDMLPDRFVLKCTHDSGCLIIVKDKSELDKKTAKDVLESSLENNYFYVGREWPYKNVPPRIIAEQFIEDEGQQPDDYKIHNFNGTPKVILVCRGRFSESGLTEDFYDVNWNHIPVARPAHPNADTVIPRPAALEKMLELSEKLSKNIPFIRTDFYTVGDRVYFGELTFYPSNGFDGFIPEKYDEIFGSWIKLPDKKENSD